MTVKNIWPAVNIPVSRSSQLQRKICQGHCKLPMDAEKPRASMSLYRLVNSYSFHLTFTRKLA